MSHLLTALGHGQTVSLRRLAAQADPPPPNRGQWEQLRAACAALGIDPASADHPLGSPGAAKGQIVASLFPATAKPPAERTAREAQGCTEWYARLDWFLALSRARRLSPE